MSNNKTADAWTYEVEMVQSRTLTWCIIINFDKHMNFLLWKFLCTGCPIHPEPQAISEFWHGYYKMCKIYSPFTLTQMHKCFCLSSKRMEWSFVQAILYTFVTLFESHKAKQRWTSTLQKLSKSHSIQLYWIWFGLCTHSLRSAIWKGNWEKSYTLTYITYNTLFLSCSWEICCQCPFSSSRHIISSRSHLFCW
jgi:hypothetical protein